MPDVATLRDSTQVVLPRDASGAVEAELDREFTVSVLEREGETVVIGSPVEIKRVTNFLVRRGISVA